jgi:predicted secreted protein
MQFSLFCILALAGVARGCPSDTPALATVPDPKMIRTFEHSSAGVNAIEIGVGHQFALRLRSNPTTGYQYMAVPGKLVSSPNSVSFIGCIYERTPVSPGLVGSGGHETWLFQVAPNAVPGTRLEIQLVRARPWLPITAEDDATVFQVVLV